MAAGDFTPFDALEVDIGLGVHNLSADVLKLGLIDSVVTPTKTDATPAWGASSGVDYDGNEVTTGTSYVTGGPTLVQTYAASGGNGLLDANDVVIALDASGFTDARWGIIYNETATNNEALGYVDLASARSIQSAGLTITIGSGIFTLSSTP